MDHDMHQPKLHALSTQGKSLNNSHRLASSLMGFPQTLFCSIQNDPCGKQPLCSATDFQTAAHHVFKVGLLISTMTFP